MIFAWLRRRRRQKLLSQPFPEEWLEHLRRNVWHYRYLNVDEQARLRDRLRIFIAEKNWEGCGGLALTEEMKVTIAAQACLIVLAHDGEDYRRVQSILVYPAGYAAPSRQTELNGVVAVERSGRLGEAHYRGPVVLSWQDAKIGGRYGRDGQNVVFHEFAHQLDFLDNASDGTPLLATREQMQRWQKVMQEEYAKLVERVEHGRPTLIDDYGATNPSEFFAVITECFFEQSVEMSHRHPALYNVLRDYYRQDPAERFQNVG